MTKAKQRKTVSIRALVQMEVSVEYQVDSLDDALALSKDLKVEDFAKAQGEMMDYKYTIVGVEDYAPVKEALYR